MSSLTQLRVELSESRQRRNSLAAIEQPTPDQTEERRRLEGDLDRLETAYREALKSQDEQRLSAPDGEGAEYRALEQRASVSNHVRAALSGQPIEGAEAEHAAALGVTGGRLPFRLLARGVEHRATTDVDAGANQGRWVDRVFADTAAMHLGVTFDSVGSGVAAYPVTTAGAAGGQRAKSQAAADAAWTVGVTELKPSRHSVRAVFSVEDDARLMGLEAAITRDLTMAITESVDLAIFKGDTGATGTDADITGLTTASIHESTITQANKASALQVLAALGLSARDGKYAASLNDLRVVAAVGAANLWDGNFANADADSMTISGFLRAQGLPFRVREGVETATTNGKFAAFVSRQRGIAGAAQAAIWDSAMLTRDIFSGAAKGEVALTISHLWAFGLPRTDNFARVKFVS